MKQYSLGALALAVVAFGGAAAFAQVNDVTEAAPSTLAAQAARGQLAYEQNCAACHGDHLDNGEVAPALKGGVFTERWAGKSLDEPYTYISTQMPPTQPGALGAPAYADILAFLLRENGMTMAAKELPADPQQLKSMIMTK